MLAFGYFKLHLNHRGENFSFSDKSYIILKMDNACFNLLWNA